MTRTRPAPLSDVKMVSPSGATVTPLMRLKTAASPAPLRKPEAARSVLTPATVVQTVGAHVLLPATVKTRREPISTARKRFAVMSATYRCELSGEICTWPSSPEKTALVPTPSAHGKPQLLLQVPTSVLTAPVSASTVRMERLPPSATKTVAPSVESAMDDADLKRALLAAPST